MLTKTRKRIRRLSAGSVAALIYSGTIFALLVSLHVYVWSLPTDGWSIRRGSDDQALMYAKLETNVVGLPSDLQPGDNVIAVEGTPLVQMVIRAYKFWQYPPPIWQDGEMLRYTVLRGERQLDIDVPTQRIGAIAHIRNSLTLAVGVTNPTAALLEVIASLAFSLVSLFVFALRPNEPASRALLIIGAAFFFQHYYMVDSIPLLGYTAVAYWFLFMSTWILAILPALLYLSLALPRPKLPLRRFPRGAPILVFGFAFLMQIGPFLVVGDDTLRALTLQRSTGWASFLYLVLPVVALGHSLATEWHPIARAQLKWMALGIGGFVVGGLAFGFGQSGNWTLGVSLIQNGGYLMLPVCIGIAIVKHRLFDIDLIIRRTLVYTAVTVLLAVVFYGSVLVFQRLLTGLTGQQSPVAIVASTLIIAALFSPLRRRVQEFVDRRFYRRKYDAQRVLSEFAAVARNETDIDTLAASFAAAVEEALRPATTRIWLAGTNDKREAEPWTAH